MPEMWNSDYWAEATPNLHCHFQTRASLLGFGKRGLKHGDLGLKHGDLSLSRFQLISVLSDSFSRTTLLRLSSLEISNFIIYHFRSLFI